MAINRGKKSCSLFLHWSIIQQLNDGLKAHTSTQINYITLNLNTAIGYIMIQIGQDVDIRLYVYKVLIINIFNTKYISQTYQSPQRKNIVSQGSYLSRRERGWN